MEIVWDEPKRVANLAKHGMDFRDVSVRFFESAIVRPAHSGRFVALGPLDGGPLVAVVFRQLGTEALSIISLRPASQSERRLHG